MAYMMTFPETVEEFMNDYKITDTEHVYSNGMELVPIFRMKQWFEHINAQQERKKGKWIRKPSPDKYHCGYVICPFCNGEYVESDECNFCSNCGADMRGENE